MVRINKEQQANFANFLYTTLCSVGKLCPEILVKKDSAQIRINTVPLISCTPSIISSPYSFVVETIFCQPGGLFDEDERLTVKQLNSLLDSFQKRGKILRLNHLGFCFRTPSIESAIKDIKAASTKSGFYTYRQKSNDMFNWIFTGDISNWREPMLEFIPIERKVFDKEIDYWLPGIHINIDSTLSYKNIVDLVGSALQGLRSVHPGYYNGFITQARVWVGVVSGINIHLDIATFAQNTRYQRKALFTLCSN